MTRNDYRSLIQVIGDNNDVSNEVVDVVGVYCLWRTCLSVASHRHGDGLIARFCERVDLVAPRVPTFREAVAHHYRRAFSFGYVMNLYSVALYDVFFKIVQHHESLALHSVSFAI